MIQLDEAQVRSLLDLSKLDAAMEAALVAFSTGEVDQPVRCVVDVEPGRGFMAAMPAHIQTTDSLGTKLVTVFHHNGQRGLPSHMATILLFDPHTGALQAIMDGRYITEVRTASVSAVSAKYLGPKEPRVAGLLGSGVQAESHVEALRRMYPGLQFKVWSPNRANLEKFAAHAGVHTAGSAREAFEDADLVVLVTASTTPVFDAAWVRPGAHVISVGACRPTMREMDPELVAVSRLIVDSRAAALRESGDVLLGGFEDHIAGELGAVIAGRVPGRMSADQTTVFKSLGLAVEDVAAARLVFDRV